MIQRKFIKDNLIQLNYKMVKVLSPFGPKIAKLKFSKQLINKINHEVDKICSNKLLVNKLDYSKKDITKAPKMKKVKTEVPEGVELYEKRGLWHLKGDGIDHQIFKTKQEALTWLTK